FGAREERFRARDVAEVVVAHSARATLERALVHRLDYQRDLRCERALHGGRVELQRGAARAPERVHVEPVVRVEVVLRPFVTEVRGERLQLVERAVALFGDTPV